MTHIILTEEQASVLRIATGMVSTRSARGFVRGHLSRPPGNAEIAEANRRLKSDGPWYTTREVFEHLDSLEPR